MVLTEEHQTLIYDKRRKFLRKDLHYILTLMTVQKVPTLSFNK